MKKLLAMMMTSVMVLSLAGCGSASGTSTGSSSAASTETAGTASAEVPDTIKIGVMGTFSGEQAVDGQNMQGAIDLVKKELEEAGGLEVNGTMHQVEFIIGDTEGKPEQAVNVMQKLIQQDGVVGVLGPNNSSDCLSSYEIAQAAGVPCISNTGTNIQVTQVGDYCFRACFIDPFQGKVVAKLALEDCGAKTAAVLYNNADAYSTGLQEAFCEAFKAGGGEIVALEAFAGTEVKDYSAQLTAIQNADPDVFFVPTQINMIPMILQQTRAMGIDCQLLGCDSWDYDYMPSLVGEDVVEGSLYVTGFSPAADSAKDFVAAYSELNGFEPSFCSSMMYEAAHIMLSGIQSAGSVDGAALRDAIAASNLDLPSGNLTYDADRNPVKDGTIIKVVDGKREFYKTINLND